MINKPLIVLAGGFGTRLQSVLKGLPKPLADINGTPFLFYLFQNWINKGFNQFILSLHYEANQIIDYFFAKGWIERYNGWGDFVAAEMLTPDTVTWLSIWHEGELVFAKHSLVREGNKWSISNLL